MSRQGKQHQPRSQKERELLGKENKCEQLKWAFNNGLSFPARGCTFRRISFDK